MAFSQEDIRRNREYFAEKLRAERQLTDVQAWVKRAWSSGDRAPRHPSRDAFAKGHIRAPSARRSGSSPSSRRGCRVTRSLVTYCWSKT